MSTASTRWLLPGWDEWSGHRHTKDRLTIQGPLLEQLINRNNVHCFSNSLTSARLRQGWVIGTLNKYSQYNKVYCFSNSLISARLRQGWVIPTLNKDTQYDKVHCFSNSLNSARLRRSWVIGTLNIGSQ